MIRILPTIALAFAAAISAPALAKLPTPDEAQLAKAAAAKARAAWSDKVAAYQLCKAQDRVATHYLSEVKGQGKAVPTPAATAACADPGPFVDPAAAPATKTAAR